MSKHLIMHIGASKTGSSAIQNFMTLNRAKLAKHGICYPDMQDKRADHYKFNLLVKKEQLDACVKIIEGGFEVADTVFLSSEFFSSYPARFNFLKELADTIQVVVYLRRQDRWLESAYQQEVKLIDKEGLGKATTGTAKTFSEWQQDNEVYWYPMVNAWAKEFGKDNLVVRPYEKSQLSGGDIIEDVLSVFNIDAKLDWLYPDVRAQNVGFERIYVDFLRLLNSVVREDDEPLIAFRAVSYLVARQRQEMTETENGGRSSTEAYLNPNERIAVLKQYEEDNRKVAQEFLDRKHGCLFYDPWPVPVETCDPLETDLSKLPELVLSLIRFAQINETNYKKTFAQLSNTLDRVRPK